MAVAWALFAAPGQGAQYARGQLIPELQLKNGTVLHGVTVVAVGSTTIVARWDGGQGTLLLSQLPAEMRADLTPVVVVKPPTPAPPPAVPVAVDPKLASAELPTEIKLTNGFVMHKSSVTRWQEQGVLVTYQGGIVTVLFKNIAPEQRGIFYARKEEALLNQAKEDARVASGQVASVQDTQAREAEEAHTREQAEAKAEEIKNGLFYHFLVKGMTKAQVRGSFGVPQEDHGDSYFYLARGLDKFGNSANRTVIFKDDILVGWQDMREGEPAGAVTH